VPAVFKLDFVELSKKLCMGAQNFSVFQLREALNLAKIAIKVSWSVGSFTVVNLIVPDCFLPDSVWCLIMHHHSTQSPGLKITACAFQKQKNRPPNADLIRDDYKQN
jgi:hypothetical protein